MQFGMEMYARFAHKVLWHDFEPGWALHKSHHEPRTGPFVVSVFFRQARSARRVPCGLGDCCTLASTTLELPRP